MKVDDLDLPPTHVLVPVHPDEPSASGTAARAALHLAAGGGALVTLLYVHDRGGALEASAQLDALSNLHQIMMAPPMTNHAAPAFADLRRGKALAALSSQWSELTSLCPQGVQLRAAWRAGDPVAETVAFIDEAGVDIVVAPAPSSCRGGALRRLARVLPHSCSCQVQTVFPPRAVAPKRRDFLGARLLSTFWKQFWRTEGGSERA